MLGVDEGADATLALCLGDHVVDQCRLARRLRTEDLADTSTWKAANAEREVETKTARGDRRNRRAC